MTAAIANPPRRRRWLRRLGLTLLAMIVLIGAAVAWKPSRVALQTLMLVPSLVDAGPQPLELFAPAPRRETLPYRSDSAFSGDLADLWLPAEASPDHRVGGMVLVLGVNNVGRNYPASCASPRPWRGRAWQCSCQTRRLCWRATLRQARQAA